MKSFTVINYRIFFSGLLLAVIAPLVYGPPQVLAHGGEDHGDAKPKTTANASGTVSHASRVGDYEVMIKHPLLVPDTGAAARLFITDFATNEAVGSTEPAIEFESENGVLTIVEIEKSDSIGSYKVKIPALPEGTYTLRAKLTYKGGTDSATFTGVSVEHPVAGAAVGGSWLQTALLFFVGAVLLGLFSTLVYFVWRFADDSRVGEETASA